MTFKKRAIISLLTVGIMCVFAIVSVVSVFAISSKSITTKVSISYISSVVGASYSFAYKNSTDEDYIYLEEDVPVTANLSSSPTYNTTGITDEEVKLSGDENPYFILRWDLKNTGAAKFTYKLKYEDSGDADSGVKITSLYKSQAPISQGLQTCLDSEITKEVQLGSITLIAGGGNVDVLSSNYCYSYFIKVTLNDKYTNALYDGDFSWTITSNYSSG